MATAHRPGSQQDYDQDNTSPQVSASPEATNRRMQGSGPAEPTKRPKTFKQRVEERKRILEVDRAAREALSEADEGGPLLFTPIGRVPRPKREWLVKGFWLRGSYGEIAGGEKSFKSYIVKAEVVAVASGRPMFGVWEVGPPAPVSVMVGEGGAAQWMSDAWQIAEAMGISEEEFSNLPIRITDQHARIGSRRFKEHVAQELDEHHPALLVIDPLYTYYGEGGDAANLFNAGSLLNSVSNLTYPRAVALQIVNHTKKGANRELSLEAITQAGHREWVDSWVVMDKRTEDADNGVFEVQMRVGGRNSGTRFYTVTLDLGPFDVDTLSFEHEPKWDVRNAKSAGKMAGDGGDQTDPVQTLKGQIARVLRDKPFELTKTEVAMEVGGNRKKTFGLLGDLIMFKQIKIESVKVTNKRGRLVDKQVLGLPGSEGTEPASSEAAEDEHRPS